MKNELERFKREELTRFKKNETLNTDQAQNEKPV